MQFTALLHHITPQLLAQSFYALRRDAAVGVDGMSWREYEEGLLQRVSKLHARLHAVYGGKLSSDAASVTGFSGHATDVLPTSTYLDPEMHIRILRIASRHIPEAGAVCGSSARTDLSGGWQVTAIPTATAVDAVREGQIWIDKKPASALGESV
ncbi:MAG: hypothetical protein ACOH2T_28065 [Pseudomonas sp.]